MVAVLLIISLTAFCGSAHSFEISEDSTHPHLTSVHADHAGCPCAPADDDGTGDSCGVCHCGCPCHAPLSAHSVNVVCTRVISTLKFYDPFIFIPDVFLSKFIPPQNLA